MTRLLRWLAGAGGALTTGVTLLATHWPTPRAVAGGENAGAAAVRESWQAMRDAADHLPAIPDVFDPLLDDKVLHFQLFVVPALLWSLALGRRVRGAAGRWLLAVLLTWAALDEASQSLTGREVELGDALTNVVGVVAGWGLGVAAARWRASRRPRGLPTHHG